jgi:hypothetical protein
MMPGPFKPEQAVVARLTNKANAKTLFLFMLPSFIVGGGPPSG